VAQTAFAAVCRTAAPLLMSTGQQLIDISCPPGTQQQTLSSSIRQANDGTDRLTDRWTDRRTPYHSTDPAPHTMEAVSINSRQAKHCSLIPEPSMPSDSCSRRDFTFKKPPTKSSICERTSAEFTVVSFV